MKIAVLGTGMVGRAHAAKLSGLGHEVFMGTRNVHGKMAETSPDAMGHPPLSAWLTEHPDVRLVSFAEAAAAGEIAYDCLHGAAALATLAGLRSELAGKLLIDIANPLDSSHGSPASLSVSNTDSLAEQIQRALPETAVVKTLNTVNASLQTDPRMLADGDHDVFVSGDDPAARERVVRILEDWYGWRNVLELGDITTARGPEMYLPLWLRIWSAVKAPVFNIKVVR